MSDVLEYRWHSAEKSAHSVGLRNRTVKKMLHGEEMMPLKKSDTTVLVRTTTNVVVVQSKSEVVTTWRRRDGRTFKPSRFVIESEWDAFSVIDLRVGLDSQFPDPQPRPGSKFQPDGPPGFQAGNGEFDTAMPGVLLASKIVNTTDAPVTLRCHWIGVVRVEADRPLETADELEVI